MKSAYEIAQGVLFGWTAIAAVVLFFVSVGTFKREDGTPLTGTQDAIIRLSILALAIVTGGAVAVFFFGPYK